MSYLRVHDISKSFGGKQAVHMVDLDIESGELVGLIGPNGSGKTTLLNLLSGQLAPDRGKVTLKERDITGLPPHRIAQAGILRMFQLTRVFDRLSALDNLMVAGRALGLDAAPAEKRARLLLEELTLTPVRGLDAGQLSGGQRKLLEFGACFMAPPKLALLDEPFAAVHPTMREVMARFVRQRHAQGQTFILVSHDMPVVKELCRRSVCMNAGSVLADGPTEQVLSNPQVIEAYLGGEAA